MWEDMTNFRKPFKKIWNSPTQKWRMRKSWVATCTNLKSLKSRVMFSFMKSVFLKSKHYIIWQLKIKDFNEFPTVLLQPTYLFSDLLTYSQVYPALCIFVNIARRWLNWIPRVIPLTSYSINLKSKERNLPVPMLNRDLIIKLTHKHWNLMLLTMQNNLDP